MQEIQPLLIGADVEVPFLPSYSARQDAPAMSATSSASASEAVRPGDSMP
jgi:hypothetical protein